MAKPPSIKPRRFRAQQVVADRYVLKQRLGAGGNGVVWLADNSALGNQVILKFPLNDADSQLHLESSNLASFSNCHPNIVNILDVGTYENRPFVVIQFLSNGALEKYLFGSGSPDLGKAKCLHENVAWLVAIAKALDYLHQNNLLHKDVKPGNILFDDSFSPYLSDFGLSDYLKVEDSVGGVYGSLPYMAPELLQSGKASSRSDQFAFAVTVFEFITGKRPFEGKSSSEFLENVHSGAKRLEDFRTDVHQALDAVFAKALSIAPENRFANCEEFANEVSRLWTFSALAWQNSLLKSQVARLSNETPTASGGSTVHQEPLTGAPDNTPNEQRPAKRRIVDLNRLLKEDD